jgi:hypothetical protein
MTDSKPNLPETFFNQSMLKAPTTHGMRLQIDLSKMYVEDVGETNIHILVRGIERFLLSALRHIDSSQGDDTFTTPGALLSSTITAIYSEPKKTPEKNGLTSSGVQWPVSPPVGE